MNSQYTELVRYTLKWSGTTHRELCLLLSIRFQLALITQKVVLVQVLHNMSYTNKKKQKFNNPNFQWWKVFITVKKCHQIFEHTSDRIWSIISLMWDNKRNHNRYKTNCCIENTSLLMGVKHHTITATEASFL